MHTFSWGHTCIGLYIFMSVFQCVVCSYKFVYVWAFFSVLKCIPILVFNEVRVFLVGLNVYEPMCRCLVEYVYTYVSEHMNVNGYNWVNFWICDHLTTEWLCKCMYACMNICALCAFVLIYKCVSKTYRCLCVCVCVYLMS